jgi:CSLREA domain-containing protein
VLLLALPAAAPAATINALNTSDVGEPTNDGDCSLREAVQAANTNVAVDTCTAGEATPDTINLLSATYFLEGAAGEDANADGDLDVNTGGTPATGGPLTINGQGNSFIDSNDADRLIHLTGGGDTLTLQNLVLQDGTAPAGNGGGVLTAAGTTLILNNAPVNQNVALNGSGGGVYAAGSLTVSIGQVTFNQATGTGGGLHAAGPVVIDSTRVINNTAGGNGGGALVSGNPVTVTGSTFFMNTSATEGAGLYVTDASNATVTDTALKQNTLNAANTPVRGAGIRNHSSTLTVTDSVVENNTANGASGFNTLGGGISTSDGTAGEELIVRRSTVAENTLTGATSIQRGAGIHAVGDPVTLVNSTLSGNSEPAAGAQGGGVYASGSSTSLIQSTLNANTAGTGTGDGNALFSDGTSVIKLRGSVVAAADADDVCATGGTGTFDSDGFNVSNDPAPPTSECSLGEPSDAAGVNVQLASFADNGGPKAGASNQQYPLRTNELATTSPAVDHVPAASCDDETAGGLLLSEDQRGFPRPHDGDGDTTADCDAGSYELYPCRGDGATTIGTAGNDVMQGTTGADVIALLGGDDSYNANSGADKICGEAGDDSLNGSGGNDEIDGGAHGAAGDTATFAGFGSPVNANLTTGQATGGPDTDTLSGIENLTGGAVGDTLTGDAAANELDGGGGAGDGDDTFIGKGGADTLDGGGGGTGDTASFAGPDPVQANLATGQATYLSATTTMSGIENLTGSSVGDTLVGDGNANVLDGGTGGNDTASFAGVNTAVNADLSTDTATGQGSDSLPNIDNLVGSSQADTLVGDAGGNTLDGADGADTASFSGVNTAVDASLSTDTATGQGADSLPNVEHLVGSGQDDTLAGDGTANTLDGAGGTDTATFAGGAAIVASLASDTATGQGSDSLPNVESLIGTSSKDRLTGDDGVNRLAGGAGNDTLNGAGEADALNGQGGKDTASFSGAPSKVNVVLGGAVSGGAGADTLTLIESLIGSSFGDQLEGNSLANTIRAGSGNDTAKGKAGNDRLFGQAGNDTVSGGSGTDTCSGGTGTNTVTGCNP